MKIILLEDVDNLGDKFQTKVVADGFARNFLIPKGLAAAATDSALKNLEQKIKFAERREARIEKELATKMAKVTGTNIEIREHAGPDGKLFGSVSARQIAAIISEQIGLEINKKRVALDSPIKKAGEYKLSFKMGDNKKTEIVVKVIPVGADGEEIKKVSAVKAEKVEKAAEEVAKAPEAEVEESAEEEQTEE